MARPFVYRVHHILLVLACGYAGIHILTLSLAVQTFSKHQQNPGNHAVKRDGVWTRPHLVMPTLERRYEPNRRYTLHVRAFDNPQLQLRLAEEKVNTGIFKPACHCLRCGDEILDIGRSQSWKGAMFCTYGCKRRHLADPKGSAQFPYVKCSFCEQVIQHFLIHDAEVGADGSYCSWKCFSKHTYELREAGRPLVTGTPKPPRLHIIYKMASRGARERRGGSHQRGNSSVCHFCGESGSRYLGHEYGLPTGSHYCSLPCVEHALGHEIDL